MNAFEQAVAAHEEWRTTFERAIHEGGHELQVGVVGADNHCLLGMWLNGEGRRAVPNPTALGMLRDIHAEFHAAAAAILAIAQEGRIREAVQAVAKDAHHQYGVWSATLLQALSQYADAEAANQVETNRSTTG